jgi:hypothetical protein
MCAFQSFYEHEMFEKSSKATFIAFIPRKIGQLDVKDFGSISLVGNVYKILAKVLAIRMQQVLGMLVLNIQNAFVGWISTQFL